MTTPILMLGAGRMGGAMIQGWLACGAFAASDLMICDPGPGPEALRSAALGARLNPNDEQVARARTVVLAVKPSAWRNIAAETRSRLGPDAIIVSICAGVPAAEIAEAFGRPVARVMPTIAAAIGMGAASLFADTALARARARALFEPLGVVTELADERAIHAATAVSGSAPAYLYAFIEALEAAGVALGLPPVDAGNLIRSTITGAAALLAKSADEPSQLRRQVTSPGGTTEAALDVLMAPDALPRLIREAAVAAARRSRELGR